MKKYCLTLLMDEVDMVTLVQILAESKHWQLEKRKEEIPSHIRVREAVAGGILRALRDKSKPGFAAIRPSQAESREPRKAVDVMTEASAWLDLINENLKERSW